MSDSKFDVPVNIGQALSALRRSSKLSQGLVAERVGVHSSRISRIEKGSVIPTEQEVEKYLDAISTEEAGRYKEFLEKKWVILNRPLFQNPQLETLLIAEDYLQKLDEFLLKPEIPGPLRGQARFYRDLLWFKSQYLLSLQHRVAYIGDIGVGKTTLACLQTGLMLTKGDKIDIKKVGLVTGSGRTTVCEVRIRLGSNYGLLIEPKSDYEIRSLVGELCSNISQNPQQSEQQSTPWESERAIRNMANLARFKEENDQGEKEEVDPLLELSKNLSPNELAAEVLQRMQLQQRAKREIWYDGASKQTGIEWMRKISGDINYGLHSEFSLPQRIDVVIPEDNRSHIFQIFDSYELEIFDTKGIDKMALRPDLREYIDDPYTIPVLTSRFNSSPDKSIQLLLKDLVDTSTDETIKDIKDRLMLLVLPRQDEALATTSDTGEEIETDAEGYELKKYQIQRELQPLKMNDIPIHFFNARSDNLTDLNDALFAQLKKFRSTQAEVVEALTEAIDDLFENQEKNLMLSAQKDFLNDLKIYMDQNRHLKAKIGPIHEYLLSQMENSHAATVRASTRRGGSWGNLDVYYLLGSGAVVEAVKVSQGSIYELKGVISNRLGNPDFARIHKFLQSFLTSLDIWEKSFLDTVRRSVESVYRATLEDDEIWQECADFWGEGPGFRSNVIRTLRTWFNDSPQRKLQENTESRIEDAWDKELISQLEKLASNSVENH